MLGSLILYLKGMRTTMFQLSGFYCRVSFNGILKGILKGILTGIYKGLRVFGFRASGFGASGFGASGFGA